MIVGLAALIFISVVVLTAYVRKFDTYVSPVSIFGFSTLYYLVGVPLELHLRGWDEVNLSSGQQSYIMLDPMKVRVLFIALLGYLTFSLTYIACIDRTVRVSDLYRLGYSHRRTVWVLSGAALFLGSYLVARYGSQIIASHNYEANVSQGFENSGYTLTVRFTTVVLGALAFYLLAFGVGVARPAGLAVVAFLIVWSVWSNDKDLMLIGVLATSGIYVRHSERFKSKLALVGALAGGVLATAVVVVAFSVNRGGGTKTVGEIGENSGYFTSTEPSGPMFSLVAGLEESATGRLSYNYGSSLLSGLVQWVPRSVWPGRPVDLAEGFARTHMQNWTPGRGFGYSLAAEGVQVWSYFGVMVTFALVGFLVSRLRALCLSAKNPGSLPLRMSIFYIVGCYVVFLTLRGPFASSVSAAVRFMVLYAILALLCRSRNDSASGEKESSQVDPARVPTKAAVRSRQKVVQR